MTKSKEHLHRFVPKRVLKTRSRCRRKLYRLVLYVENDFIKHNYPYKLRKNRLKIKACVYLYLADRLGVPVKHLQFKSMSNRQCVKLERLLDRVKPDIVAEWVMEHAGEKETAEQIGIVINGE